MYITPPKRLYETDDPTAMNTLIDISGSMVPLHEEGIPAEAIKQVMLPALSGINEVEKNMLRISLGTFSEGKIRSVTRKPGYFRIEEIMQMPITKNCFLGNGRNGITALYGSIIAGIESCTRAAEIIRQQMHFRSARAEVVIITDGEEIAHNFKPEDVRKTIKSFERSPIKLRVQLAYFNSGVGIDRNKFMRIAKACGLESENCHFWADHGTDMSRQKKAFRRLVLLLSDRSKHRLR